MDNERKHAGGGDAGDRRQEGGNNNTEEEQRRNKQHAKYGQWQTPPLPAFAATSGIVPPPSSTTAATTANTTTTGINLPTNADEYARMLQEAYKKGAEAGASASMAIYQQQATEQINFLGGTAMSTTEQPSIGLPLSPVGQYVNVNNNPPSMATAQIEPLIPNIPMSNIIDYKTSFFPTPTPVPSSSMGEGRGEFLIKNMTTDTQSSFSQSKSMPDMSSYSSQVNDEEDKRKKRLARNRASARLRRLKKKNLVDSYEGEVGILESALSKLRSHQWGSDIIDHEVLIEALSMERGQQPLTPEGRRELIQSILNQQREQVANLLECQMESWLLCSVATTDNHDDDDVEMVQLTSELKSLLNLSPEQISQIEQCSQGCLHEVQDLFTVDDCLQSIHTNQWLLDEGVDEVAGQFTSILNQSQLSKFLLWSDHNAEAIEKLDYVNVLVGQENNAPLFEFGVDEGIADGEKQ